MTGHAGISTDQQWHLRRHDGADPAHHGAEAEQRVARVRGEQLRRVHVDTAERLRDCYFAEQVQECREPRQS